MAAPAYGSHVQNLETFIWALAGQRTADGIEAISFDAPWDGALVFFEVTARASGGTAETLDIDIQQGTTSLLSAPVACTAAARTEATLATANTFAKDVQISVDLDLGGTSPTWDDICIVAMFERR